jgi:hypothetical protein
MASLHERKRRFRGIEREQEIAKIQRTAAQSEYRGFADKREKAARLVLDDVCSPELAAAALGVSHSSVHRAVEAIKNYRVVGRNGLPAALTPTVTEKFKSVISEANECNCSLSAEQIAAHVCHCSCDIRLMCAFNSGGDVCSKRNTKISDKI